MIAKFKKIIIKNNLLVSILVLAILLRFIGLMPNIIYADEAHIQVYAWNLVKNIITHGDFNPHTFKYGSLVFYLQAYFTFPIFIITYLIEAIKLFFSSNSFSFLTFTTFHEVAIRKYTDLLIFVGRAEIASFGVISIFLIYLIGKKLFNKNVGLWAALFLSLAPMHVRESHYMITDVLFVFTILLSLLFFIYLYQEKSFKWFILSGIVLGISSTIRFLPLMLLIYPVVLIFSFQKQKIWLTKVLTSVLAIFLGVFLGVPFLFLDPQGPALFIKDLAFYALPWYGTNVSTILLQSALSILSGSKIGLPNTTLLYPAPQYFRPLHISWIFFNGLGPVPTIFSILGLMIIFLTSFRKFLLLIITPLAYFIYISLYIPAIYEKLSLPVLPFLAIFAAVFSDKLYSIFKPILGGNELLRSKLRSIPAGKFFCEPFILAASCEVFWFNNKKSKKWFICQRKTLIVLIIILFVSSSIQLLKTVQASISCNQITVQKQSAQWVDNYIPDSAKVGYLTPVSVSSVKQLAKYFALEPKYNLSLREAQEKGADYVFLNAGRLDYETYPYFIDFFIVPIDLYENSYYFLSLAEYKSQARLLKEIVKPMMCDPTRIYYYKLPDLEKEASVRLKNFEFTDSQDLKYWQLQDFGYSSAQISFDNKVGKEKEGSLLYQQNNVKYTPPRIRSVEIPIKTGEIYTFSFWVKNFDQISQPRIFGRMDFYTKENEELINKIKQKMLLLQEGSTPNYFEKELDLNQRYHDFTLPGQVTLSARIKLNNTWQRISLTAKAPINTQFAVLSIQNVNQDPGSFYVDNIEFLGLSKN